MKKTAFLMTMIFAAAAALTGCKDDTTTQQTPAANLDVQTPPVIEGETLYNEVYLWTEQDEYLPETEVINITFSNNTDEEFCIDERFKLYRVYEKNGENAELPYKDGGDYFTELAQIIPAHDSAVFTANIAEHYDLPLDVGTYCIEIGGMKTCFSISEDAFESKQNTASLSMITDQRVYPPKTEHIKVTITNNGTADYHVSLTDFAIEKFDDGAVSMTPWYSEFNDGTRLGSTIAPGESDTWELLIREFSGMKLTEGEYAVYLNGKEARFTVSKDADAVKTANADLPEIAFICEVEGPTVSYDEPVETGYAYSEILITRDAECYVGEGHGTTDELIAMYLNNEQTEHFDLVKVLGFEEVADMYHHVQKEAENGSFSVLRDNPEMAVAAKRERWYILLPNEQGSLEKVQIGEHFQHIDYLTDNENVNADYERLRGTVGEIKWNGNTFSVQ